MAFRLHRPSKTPRCQFCGTELADPMVAFMEHLDEAPLCRMLWDEERENIKRESGGT